MEFEVELYSSLFSSVRASNCGQFVLKQSKRNLNTEIEVLHKLQKCIYIPKLIDVINEHTIVIESLKNVSSNEVSLNLVGVSDSINDYIKSNHVDMSLMTFDASYISKELSILVDEIYLEKNSEVSESIFQLKSIFYRLSSIYKKLKKQSFEKNLQHGDIHIGNVMKRGNDIVLIDWEDAIWGHNGINQHYVQHDVTMNKLRYNIQICCEEVFFAIRCISLFIIDFLRFDCVSFLFSYTPQLTHCVNNLSGKCEDIEMNFYGHRGVSVNKY